MAEWRSRTLTFLFTDIEGSTRRWELDPEGMRVELTAHDAVLRAAIEGHGGDWFKHTGDGAAAVFDSAPEAVAAAIQAQRELGLPVRMGLASGQAQPRDGDYFGTCVNRAARVMGAAHGGQILLADSTAGLVDTRGYIDLGVHTLRDVSVPIRLTQVAVDGLEIDFPPVSTVGAVHGNLVAPSSRLIGRGDQLDELVTTVRDHRLVTLTGMGGVGKTRLAEEVAGLIADEFPDGVWVVELAATGTADVVPSLVADTLKVRVETNSSRTESILHALSGQKLLILLDNCEHVMDGVQRLVETVLQAVDSVTVLATSRESLGIPGERVWPVPPLDVEAGTGSEAVSLFVERAQAANPRFRPAAGSAELAAVAHICVDLDGLALAIELAAARMVSMSPQDVAQRLDHRLQLLSAATAPGGAPHHRTLRDTVAWSYELLDADERSLLARCAVFASGFELESVHAVIEDPSLDEYAVLDLLDSLVRKSLIVVDMSHDRTRYRMLETIRQFAEEQLERSELTHDLRHAHAAFFSTRSQEMWEVWNSPSQRDAIDWLDIEFAELRAGFRWAADNDEVELAARIASHATMLSFVLQRFEPVAWVNEIIDAATDADIPQLPRLRTAACVSALAGGHQSAIDHAHEAIRLESEPGRDPFEYGWSHFWEAIGHRYLGDFERWFEICGALAERTGLAHVMGSCGLLGVLPGVGRQEEARAMADDVVAVAKQSGIPFWISWARTSWARAYASSDPVAALVALRSSLEYAREYRIDYIGAIVLRETATLEGTRGGVHEALDMFSTVIDEYRRSGNSASAATTLGEIAVMFDRLDRPEIAATTYGASVPLGFAIAENLPPVLDRLRDQLGQEKFDECVAVGSAMDFTEAMAYTRRVLDVATEQFAGED
ncbi:ATP-binding protein [Ilumatobacter sp.]|uniref:ATP-binding protein n=1 Tax=Ilumatobacter sp. TaxID=1967498 RepID=UPI003C69F267